MFSKSGYNDNLKELIKAKKADKSVVNTIKENIEIQTSARSNIKKNEREIKKLNAENDDKMIIKTQTPIFNFKDYMSISKEIRDIKKQIKQKSNEVKSDNKKMERAELHNNKIEEEINSQFKIYQENEIYVKAVKQLDRESIPEESYAAYEKHIDEYENAVYSIEKQSKLPQPDAKDFVVILSVLKEKTSKKKSASKKIKKDNKKNTTTKKTTSKKETNKKVTKK